MTLRRTKTMAVLTGLILIGSAVDASAQITNGGTASQNVRASAARSPGHMVSAGLGRAQNAVRDPFIQPQITELPPLIGGFNTIFVPQAIEVLAQQISDFFQYFIDLLLQRADWPPLSAAGNTTSTTTDTGNGTSVRPGRGTR